MKQHKKNFSRKDAGFTLTELIIYMGLLGILLTMVFSTFIPVMQSGSRQWRIGETKMETDVGLDLLRGDLEHAGFGLPWEFPVGVTPAPYSEPALLPDTPNVPRAVNSQDNSASSMNNADYLVIRATNVAINDSSQKWGWLGRNAAHGVLIETLSDDAFDDSGVDADRVIVIRPAVSPGEFHRLVLNGTAYFTKPAIADLTPFAPPETPNDPNGERYLVYSLGTTDPRRPFNRTDYYINAPSAASPLPAHCAPGTGTLLKATVNQADDDFTTIPIVDCVADFQVVYYLDTDNDGGWDTRANASGLNGLTAKQIREQVKSIRCYVLSHEGGADQTYTHPNANINVGDIAEDGVTLQANGGRAFDLNAFIGATWPRYRWKVYGIAVTPRNLQ